MPVSARAPLRGPARGPRHDVLSSITGWCAIIGSPSRPHMSECSSTSEWAHCREKCVHHLPSKSFTFEQSRAHSCGV